MLGHVLACAGTVLSNWSAPEADLLLTDLDVHVWRAFPDSECAQPHLLEALLSDEERARASRYVFPRDRDRFLSTRGILRSLLSRYLGRPPSAIEFAYEPAGKPALRPLSSDPRISFNVSHSGAMAVYAFSSCRDVGIDVEAVRFNNTNQGLAERFFSTAERAELLSLPVEKRNEAFFRYWTCKEAYVKARGVGLGIPLNSFDVSLAHGRPERLAGDDSARWMLRSFRPAEGYVGAVVAEGKNWGLRFWNWASAGE